MDRSVISPLSKLVCFSKIIFQGVWINRFQVFLTTLTMSFGSLGLALTIFLGDGAQKVLWADLSDLLGSWVVIAPDGGPNMELLKTRITPLFTAEDLEHVKTTVKIARLVSPAYIDMPVNVNSRDKGTRITLDAITKDLSNEKIFQPISGFGLSDSAYDAQSWECMATEKTMQALGLQLNDNPTLFINGQQFKVVGIVTPPPLANERFQQRVVVPYNLARALWMVPGDIGKIIVAWNETKDMGAVIAQIKTALDQCRGPQTYILSSSQFQIQSGKNIINNFIVVGATQSLFCVFIASIGVLNVMLTNVARRTHEFAIRIAMGARQQDILIIVLAEGIFVGLIGAAIGLVIAVAIAPILGGVMSKGIREMAHLSPIISLRGFLIPLAICGICSLIAGLIPALKIRKVDILSALRENV
jgi:ABC-type antimicrobial peptide transport system permease subunit